jgi:SRSO17 transposase
LDCALYLPKAWFDEAHNDRRQKCDIPEDATFRTKPQFALDMIAQIQRYHALPFKWVGCDSAFGSDAAFRASLPESTYFFADVRSNQCVFLARPEWSIPERTSNRGRAPSVARAGEEPRPVSAVVLDESLPWEEVIMEGSKGPVRAQVKCRRVIECVDGVDGEELWLYIRKYENGDIKYAFSNAPVEMEKRILHSCATLRWPIEQCFQECKSYLGMSDYETRSFTAWHRHMLLVMVAFLFVLEVRQLFAKKTILANPGPF